MRKRFGWSQCLGLGAFILAGAMATPARAGSITLFGAVPTSGSVGYLGGVNPLFGLGISLDGVLSADTLLNSGALTTCVGCELSFVTGNFIVGSSTAWSFDGGGFFSITGGVDLTGNGVLGDVGDVAAGSTLLSGSFGNSPITPFAAVVAGTNPFAGVGLSYFDAAVNGELATYFGESPLATGYLAFHLNGVGDAPGTFESTEIQDMTVVAATAPVPEPSSLLVFAVGLLVLPGRRFGRVR
jgi:hypothetical protein